MAVGGIAIGLLTITALAVASSGRLVLVMPILPLAAILAVAVALGLMGSILPARFAVRVDPLLAAKA